MEIDYEKAYKAALETATKWIKDGYIDKEKICLECVFPELRESEDERIRKDIIEIIKNVSDPDCYVYLDEKKQEKYIAWLEKQKESLHDSEICKENVDSFTSEDERIRKELIGYAELKLNYFTAANSKNDIDKKNQKWWKDVLAYLERQKEQKPAEYLSKRKVYDIMNKLTELSTSELIPFESEEYVKIHEITSAVCSLLDYPIEPKPAEWDEIQSEFKNINEAFEDGKKEVVAHPEKYGLCKPAEWNNLDKDILNDAITAVDLLGNDESFNKSNPNLANAFRVAKDWLRSLPERFNLQPKQEWSEEDETYYDTIVRKLQVIGDDSGLSDNQIKFLREHCPSRHSEWSEEDEKMLNRIIETLSLPPVYDTKACAKMVDFLKSLRPQYHGDVTMTEAYKMGLEAGKASSWKPSEEQMDAFSQIVQQFKPDKELESLYNDLKKLGVKEEPEYYQHFDPDC